MLENEICPLEEIAAALGREPSWLKRNWRHLNRTRSFPRPLPGSDYERWSRCAVMAWLQTGGESEPEKPGDFVSRARAALHAELGVDA